MSLNKVLNVLVVDDHITSRMLTVDGLMEMGISNVQVAKDGRDAFNKVVTSPVHLLISDVHMPDINGLQLVKAIRNHPQVKNMGVIILTGKKDAKVVALAKQLGVNNVLAKPFCVPDLRKAIESVFGKLT